MPILALVVVALIVGLSSFIPISRNYGEGIGSVAGITTLPKVVSDKGQTALVSSTSGALSHFPLTVNPQDNTLTVTTPAGTKTVTVLPDQAIKNLQASYVLDDIVSEKTQGALASVEKLVKLEEKDGLLGYNVSGFRKHDLFGITLFKTKVEAFISAENGQVVSSTQSLLGKILNKLAP